jgi:hypothetical protein
MATNNSTNNNNRNRMLMIVGGIVAVLALCVCAVGGLGVGGYFYYQRSGGTVTTAQQPAVEYLLDASPRMAQPTDGGTRLELARGILAEVIRPASAATSAGLRVFGNGALAQACQDTNLLVPLAVSNQSKIAEAATGVEAGSQTDAAMAEAMVNAIRDLANTKGPHTLVVITGGKDDCQAQAGELIKAEAAKAGITLEEFVVGFQLSAADSAAVKSLVAASSSGPVATYLDAPDADTLRNILSAIQAHVDQPVAVPIAIIQQAATPGAVIVLPTLPPANTPEAGATSATGGATPVPSNGFVGQTACDHPYMPIRTGSTWTYGGDGGAQTWTVTSVTGDQNTATAVVNITVPDGTVTYNWHCDAQGIRLYESAGINAGGVTTNITISNEKGVTILGPALLVPGATWDHSYDMNFDMQGTSGSMSFVQSFTAGSVGTETFSFGTFDTISVAGTQSMTMSMLNQSFSGTQSMELAKGVGLVKMSSTTAGSSYQSTLQSYQIPK